MLIAFQYVKGPLNIRRTTNIAILQCRILRGFGNSKFWNKPTRSSTLTLFTHTFNQPWTCCCSETGLALGIDVLLVILKEGMCYFWKAATREIEYRKPAWQNWTSFSHRSEHDYPFKCWPWTKDSTCGSFPGVNIHEYPKQGPSNEAKNGESPTVSPLQYLNGWWSVWML